MTHIRHFGFIVLLIILVFGWVVFAIAAVKKTAVIKEPPQPIDIAYETVDSVWYLSPGELHSLQVDYLYYAKTESGYKFKTSRLMKVGDTVHISHK